MGDGLVFILLYLFVLASILVFRRLMRDRARINAESELLPTGIKFTRFVVISALSALTGWGAFSGRLSADFSATIFYGGIALTTFLTTVPTDRG